MKKERRKDEAGWHWISNRVYFYEKHLQLTGFFSRSEREWEKATVNFYPGKVSAAVDFSSRVAQG